MGTQVKLQRDGRVIIATLDNPPHGLMTPMMVAELDALSLEAEADDGIGAVVLTGAHPERFLAHYDVAARGRRRVSLALGTRSPHMTHAALHERRGAR